MYFNTLNVIKIQVMLRSKKQTGMDVDCKIGK